jgi:hypothetical protein
VRRCGNETKWHVVSVYAGVKPQHTYNIPNFNIVPYNNTIR